jgi:hypothetical protein
MSGFESSSFKKNVPQGQQKPLREFTVGAPEDFAKPQMTPTMGQQMGQQELSQEEIETQIREARRQKLANANKIGDAAKKRIELLADIGRLTKDVNIGGYTFSLRTLKNKETKDAALATFSTSITQIEASYEARKQQLARAIFKIDGEDLSAIIGSNNIEDALRFIDESLEDIVVEKLWEEFIALKEESRTKYGINSVKEAEEVSEDLKK